MSKYVVDLMRQADESILEITNHDNQATIEEPLAIDKIRVGDFTAVTEEPITKKVFAVEIANTVGKEELSRTLLNSEIACSAFIGHPVLSVTAHLVRDVIYGDSMKDVFDTWTRISHKFDVSAQPAVPDELGSWVYDQASDLLECTINSTSFLGFVSPSRYDVAVSDCILHSEDPDNDLIAVIVGYEVVDGQEHTITVTRTRSVEPHMRVSARFDVWYNYHQADAHLIATMNPPGDTDGSWVGQKTRVRVERNGDLFVAKCSNFMAAEDSAFTDDTLTNELTFSVSANPELAMFDGPSSWGYGCMSQGKATFTILQRADQESASAYRELVDIGGRLWRYGYEERVVAENIDVAGADINTTPVRNTTLTLTNREYEPDAVDIRYDRIDTNDVVGMSLSDGDFDWFDPSLGWVEEKDVPAAIAAFKAAALRQNVSIDNLKTGQVTLTVDTDTSVTPNKRTLQFNFTSKVLRDGMSARYTMPTFFQEIISNTRLNGFEFTPFAPENVIF